MISNRQNNSSNAARYVYLRVLALVKAIRKFAAADKAAVVIADADLAAMSMAAQRKIDTRAN